jgi:hypothetical protein
LARLGRAWLILTVALACHVLDEALTGFLDVYNPIVRSARARFGWFPMPEFTFDVWLVGLCVLVALLFAISPFAYRGSRLIRLAAYPYPQSCCWMDVVTWLVRSTWDDGRLARPPRRC